MASHSVGWGNSSVFTTAFSSSKLTMVGALRTPSIRTTCSRRSIVTRATTSPAAVPTRIAIGARKARGTLKRTPLLSAVAVSCWVCRTVRTSAEAAVS